MFFFNVLFNAKRECFLPLNSVVDRKWQLRANQFGLFLPNRPKFMWCRGPMCLDLLYCLTKTVSVLVHHPVCLTATCGRVSLCF